MVVGDPGAGKTTFLRRVAQVLCQSELGIAPDATRERLGLADDRTFPVLVRLSELAQYLARHQTDPAAPNGPDAPAWLPHYLAAVSRDHGGT